VIDLIIRKGDQELRLSSVSALIRRMNSRERVFATLEHTEPDRVPYDLGSGPVTSITCRAYQNLLGHLGIEEEVTLTDHIQQLANVSEVMLDRLEVDTRGLWAKYNHTHNFNPVREGEYMVNRDEWSFTYSIPVDPEHAHWYDLTKFPLFEKKRIAMKDVEAFDWPDGGLPWRIEGLKEIAMAAHEQGKVTFCRGCCAGVFEMALRLRGYEGFFPDMIKRPDVAQRILDKVTEHKLAFWDLMLGEMGEYVDIIGEADDIGTQSSYLCSPDMYREMIKPCHKEIFDLVRSHAKRLNKKIYIFFHSDGVNREILDDFVELGIDIFNPLQFTCPGMDTADIKKTYCDVMTFWGGLIDTQKVLPFGTTDEVREQTKRQIDILAPGGGFVACTVHNIQHEVPPENIMAMWETLREHGVY